MINNNKTGNSFYKIFIIIFIFNSLLIFCIKLTFPLYYDTSIWLIQAFFLIIILSSHAVAEYGLKKKDEFHSFYLGSMAIRFLLSIIFIFFVLFNLKQNPVIFIVAFFILYLVYTSFEIYFLLRNLRTDLKSDGTNNKIL